MTDLSDVVRPEAVQTGWNVANKKILFQQIGQLAAAQGYGEARQVAERLADRERLGSTGFGGGVAIPHAKLEGLTAPVGLFVRLAQPIEFQAVDDLPVDLVFTLLSPVDAGQEHLKALARISRRLRDRPFVDKLRGAGSPDALYALFTTPDPRRAA